MKILHTGIFTNSNSNSITINYQRIYHWNERLENPSWITAVMWASQVPSIKDFPQLEVLCLFTESSLKLILLHSDFIQEHSIIFLLLLPSSIKKRFVPVAKCLAMIKKFMQDSHRWCDSIEIRIVKVYRFFYWASRSTLCQHSALWQTTNTRAEV